MGKSTIHGHFQSLSVCLPEGMFVVGVWPAQPSHFQADPPRDLAPFRGGCSHLSLDCAELRRFSVQQLSSVQKPWLVDDSRGLYCPIYWDV